MLEQVGMLKFWDVVNGIFVHWTMKLTLSSRQDDERNYKYVPTTYYLTTFVLPFILLASLATQARKGGMKQYIYLSDRPKQCFTVLPEPNRTSQVCFPNRNEPNMKKAHKNLDLNHRLKKNNFELIMCVA